MRRLVPLSLALILVWPAKPAAWGAPGHHIVAKIALSHLTPEAKRAAQAILGEEDFVAMSTWADQVRSNRPESYNWHFVDIPVNEPKYDEQRDCPPTERGDCVIKAIARLRVTARDASAPAEQRREALKFLIHFVGDLHQPLHSIDNKDKGGNDVKVNWDAGRTSNLHSVWDGGLIQRRGLDEDGYVKMLLADLETHPLTKDEQTNDVVKWVEATHQVALASVYGYPEFTPGVSPASPITLDEAYVKRGMATIERQLQLGGVHLASLLNEILR